MQKNINKEIRNYQEDIFMGLNLRQIICSVAALAVAGVAYLLLEKSMGQESASWVCIVAAFPVAAAGFFTYDGLTLEQFLWTAFRSSFLCAGPRMWKAENRYRINIKARKETKH